MIEDDVQTPCHDDRRHEREARAGPPGRHARCNASAT
jgi:hypothetical protein